MDLLAAWVAFPAVLLVLAGGWGLLLEVLAGRALPGGLVPGAGFAALVVALAVPALAGSGAAPLATPFAVAGAVAGVALWAGGVGPRRRSPRPDGGALALALAAFAIYAAPVVLSGEPAIAGYIRLDDTATWLALADHALAEGRSTSGLGASTHDVLLRLLDSGDYPVGALVPFAVGAKLVGQDLAWVFGPYVAFLAALLALALDVLLVPAIARRALRGAVACVAAASALLFGYAMWGGIKEIATAALLATVAALGAGVVPEVGRGIVGRVRAILALAVACAAVLGVVSVGGVLWLAPILAVLSASVARRLGGRETWRLGAVLAGVVVVCSIGPLLGAGFARGLRSAPAQAAERLGNLRAPLSPFQTLGIWPVGDFRLHPSSVPTVLLLAILVAVAGAGVARLVRLRAWGVLAYGGGVLVAAVVIALYGWPWIDAKSYAIASPAPVMLAGVGVAAIGDAGRRALAVAAGIAIVGGVAWSDALSYHDVTLTPQQRHAELVSIGRRFAGKGPTLMTEYEPYGARWFLRAADAEGAGELRTRVVPLVGGDYLLKAQSADIDAFATAGLGDFRTLVLRRSPVASRPPSSFRLAWRGEWYEVWQRDQAAAPIRAHLALGTSLDPAGVASCADVLTLGRTARTDGGSLFAAVAPATVVAGLQAGPSASAWEAGAAGTGTVVPRGGGAADATAQLPFAGRWAVWLGGAPKGPTTVTVDGVVVGRTRGELGYPGQWVPVGAAVLSAGPHAVAVRVSGGGLRPGTGNVDRFEIGPVAFAPVGATTVVVRVAPDRAQTLCGHRLDWIEAVG